MSEIQKLLIEIFQDHDGYYSFKRVGTFLCVLLLIIGFLANLFLGYKIEQFIFDSVSYIVMVGLGVTASEKFAPKKGG